MWPLSPPSPPPSFPFSASPKDILRCIADCEDYLVPTSIGTPASCPKTVFPHTATAVLHPYCRDRGNFLWQFSISGKNKLRVRINRNKTTYRTSKFSVVLLIAQGWGFSDPTVIETAVFRANTVPPHDNPGIPLSTVWTDRATILHSAKKFAWE